MDVAFNSFAWLFFLGKLEHLHLVVIAPVAIEWAGYATQLGVKCHRTLPSTFDYLAIEG